ncbi:hypothetical protein BD626DRAFT_478334 [Schizophyllum amplum]|uniref:Uncharacterized protein n=1 Tax=Schizophyllum amplum TaxID=97359 RepID=A0A550CRA4_9AGAR|nr:hypothetical protein BD626DRAFT_478334 [Auriculariopsis ampla]
MMIELTTMMIELTAMMIARARSIIFVVTTCSIFDITWTTLSCSPRGRRRCCALRLDGVVVLAVGDGVVVLAVGDGIVVFAVGVVVFAVRTASSCSTSPAGIFTRASVT